MFTYDISQFWVTVLVFVKSDEGGFGEVKLSTNTVLSAVAGIVLEHHLNPFDISAISFSIRTSASISFLSLGEGDFSL